MVSRIGRETQTWPQSSASDLVTAIPANPLSKMYLAYKSYALILNIKFTILNSKMYEKVSK